MQKWEIISLQHWKIFCVVKQSLGQAPRFGNQQSSAGHLLVSIHDIPWSPSLQRCPVAVATCTEPDFWRVLFTRADTCLPKPFLQAWPTLGVQCVWNYCIHKSSLILHWNRSTSTITEIPSSFESCSFLPVSASFYQFFLLPPCPTISNLQWPKAENSIRPLMAYTVSSFPHFYLNG